VNDISVIVRQDLELHMARVLDIFFNVNIGVLEILFRFGLGQLERAKERYIIMANAHALTATTRRSFDDDRIFDLLGDRKSVLRGLHNALPPGVSGTPALRAVSLAVILSPIIRMVSGVGQ